MNKTFSLIFLSIFILNTNCIRLNASNQVNHTPTTYTLEDDVNTTLESKKIVLPQAPAPVGNYLPYVIANNLVYINQVALKDGKILNPGQIPTEITEEQAKEATYQTMLNIVAVLKEATGGNLNRVKRCVQLTGFFYTQAGYDKHASLMNSASNLVVDIFGEKGKHARATIGAVSLPLNSPVEIQAIFEIE